MSILSTTKMQELLAKARADKLAREANHDKEEPKQAAPTKAQTLQEKIANLRLEKSLQSSTVQPAPITAPITAATVTTPAPAPTPVASTISPPVTTNKILEEVRARLILAKQQASNTITPTTTSTTTSAPTGMGGNVITYNAEQQQFIDLASSGKSCVLIGAAGTGKTTCSQGGIQAIIQAGRAPIVKDNLGHKHIPIGSVGVLIVAFTRRAVNNSRRVQAANFKSNCITAHKLLEYAPEYFEVIDPETGNERRTMQFLPSRHENNKLPQEITTIIIEEASMLSVELFKQIVDALPNPSATQFIFIGDIQQLPPVFGSAILGFTLNSLPVVELKTVYRQALESPIIRLAHRILSGVPIPATDYATAWKVENKLTIHPWKKKLTADLAASTLAAFFKAAIDNDQYSPYEDMILIPHNKGCGTIEVNAHIANHLARKRGAITYEIMAGYNKHYFSAGDKVLYEKEDAEIVSIEPNRAYSGTRVQAPSATLDYWGFNPNSAEDYAKMEGDSVGLDSSIDVDLILSQMASDSEERVTQASHKLVLRLVDSERDVTISTSAEVNAMLHSYALTVHKSQGSEWRKVFVCLHQSHAGMLQRELLYTAVTRAKEELYCICEPESFTKGILSQRIKGDTLKEKAEFFKGKIDSGSDSTWLSIRRHLTPTSTNSH